MDIYKAEDVEGNYGSRAMSAYFKQHEKASRPFPTSPEIADVDGRMYVVLFNGGGILEVYRVTNMGALKRIKQRIPKPILEHYQQA